MTGTKFFERMSENEFRSVAQELTYMCEVDQYKQLQSSEIQFSPGSTCLNKIQGLRGEQLASSCSSQTWGPALMNQDFIERVGTKGKQANFL